MATTFASWPTPIAWRLPASARSGPPWSMCHTTKGLHYGRLEGTARLPRHARSSTTSTSQAMRSWASRFPARRATRRRIRRGQRRRWAAQRRDYLDARLDAAPRGIPAGAGAGGPHGSRAGRPPHGRLRQLRAARRPAAGAGLSGRRFRSHPQGHRGVVRLGHEEHGVLLRRRAAT